MDLAEPALGDKASVRHFRPGFEASPLPGECFTLPVPTDLLKEFKKACDAYTTLYSTTFPACIYYVHPWGKSHSERALKPKRIGLIYAAQYRKGGNQVEDWDCQILLVGC